MWKKNLKKNRYVKKKKKNRYVDMHECALQQKLVQHCKSTILQEEIFKMSHDNYFSIKLIKYNNGKTKREDRSSGLLPGRDSRAGQKTGGWGLNLRPLKNGVLQKEI